MDQKIESSWIEIGLGTNLQQKTPEELLNDFQEIMVGGATVLREKFSCMYGVVKERESSVLTKFKIMSLGEGNLHLNGEDIDGIEYNLNINEPINTTIQDHGDGKKSIITSRESKSRPGLTVIRRFTPIKG